MKKFDKRMYKGIETACPHLEIWALTRKIFLVDWMA